MKDDPDPLEPHAFVDGELDLSRQLAVEQALIGDPALRARVETIRDLRAAVRDGAVYHTVPETLRDRIDALIPSAESIATVPPQRGRAPSRTVRDRWGRWLDWRPLSTAIAATVALTFGTQLYMARADRQTRLVDEVVASHVRATLGEHPIDVTSSDHHTVKPWLSSKLDFSPPVRDTDLGRAVFQGGRVDYLDGRPVAALVYRLGPHLVDDFVWPASGGDREPSFTVERGFQIAHWNRQGMNHWVVSDVNRAEFVDLVDRLASPADVTPAAGG